MLYQTDDYEEQDFIESSHNRHQKNICWVTFISIYSSSTWRMTLRCWSRFLEKVKPITPDHDAKLQKLLALLPEATLNQGKRLIFTQYARDGRLSFRAFEQEQPDRRGRNHWQHIQEQVPPRRQVLACC